MHWHLLTNGCLICGTPCEESSENGVCSWCNEMALIEIAAVAESEHLPDYEQGLRNWWLQCVMPSLWAFQCN